ncbi:hypothetical protein, partial [Candidatus Bandiella numerosa]|uniref:hypothetical protein n=1 Tax=Candidatus Bandiella numerosa TaxID=2570586 RepID=UPI001F19ED5C
LFSIRSSASLTKNDILPPLSYVLIFSFYHICFFLPIMQWSFKDNLFIIVSENIINLIKIENYKLHKEKTLHFNNLENYDSCQFTQVIRNKNFFKSLISIINEIFDLLKIDCEKLKKPKIDLKNELCEGIINKYLNYFEIIKTLEKD